MIKKVEYKKDDGSLIGYCESMLKMIEFFWLYKTDII